MNRRHGFRQQERGQGTLAYALLLALVAIVVVLVINGGVRPRPGLLAPLRGLSGILDGIVSGLSAIARQASRPFRFGFRLP